MKEMFLRRAQRFNCYRAGEVTTEGRSCANCVRKQFSYPWTCDDGWSKIRNQTAADGERCENWTDQGNARVD